MPCDWIFKMHSKEAVHINKLKKKGILERAGICMSVSTFPFAENKLD